MKSSLLQIVVSTLLCTIVSFPSKALEKKKVGLTADITWASKYLISGFKVGGDDPVWQLAGKLDWYQTGFSFMYWTAIQANRDNKQYDEQDLFLMYSRDFFADNRYAINLHGFYDYWMFPNTEPVRDEFGDVTSTSKKHGNKFQLGLSLPKLIPLADSYVVPSYNVYYLHYYAQDRKDRYLGGTHHELLLEYYRSIRLFIPKATYQYAGATASTNYHQGDFGVKSGLSHSTASMVTGVYAFSSIFTLSMNHQWSYEETVNPNNEFWTTFSFIKKY